MDLGNFNRSHVTRLIALLVPLSLLASGCIRPVEEKPTPRPTDVVVFQQTPVVGSPTNTVPPATNDGQGGAQNVQLANAINQYFLNFTGSALPMNQNGMGFWNTILLEPDRVVGFLFNNPSGLPCVGVAAYRIDLNGANVVYSGGYHCTTDPTAKGVAGQWLVGLSDGQTSVLAITGRITEPNVLGVAVEFQNGTSQQEPLQNGNFLFIRTDFVFADRVTIPSPEGNLLGQLAVPMNPAG